MDRLLNEFRNNQYLHNKVVQHLIDKDVPTNVANLFYQTNTWHILADLIEKGEFHFKELTEGYIDKLTGKGMSYEKANKRNFENVRMIYMFEYCDRAVAHMLYLLYYKEFIGLSDDRCVSYKEGIGTSKIAKQLTEEMCEYHRFTGYKGDIRHYFDDVNIESIEKQLMEMKTGSKLDDILWELYHDDRVLVNGKITHRHRGLIQGCAFACLLANLILKDIDKEIKNMNVIYYRYSDDFIILGSPLNAKLALNKVDEMLKPKGLMLHPNKVCKIDAKNDWFEFLGFSFHLDKRSVSEKTLNNLKHEIKTRTMSKTRQAHKEMTEIELRRMIDSLQSYLFTAYAKDKENFGMGVYLFGTINVPHDINAIDEYCKDCLRAAYTNRTNIYGLGYVHRGYVIDNCNTGKNCKQNNEKTFMGTEDDILKKCGWVSLNKMFNDYHTNMYLFENSVYRMANGLM